ncbi:unnamed protein product [Orchesella dallaii]|uniref:C2H2-type domain-containing protein n=1 Tax=Orchesella dallaii TaxID=48710 RepID=A0ABP1QVA5_9HEXA
MTGVQIQRTCSLHCSFCYKTTAVGVESDDKKHDGDNDKQEEVFKRFFKVVQRYLGNSSSSDGEREEIYPIRKLQICQDCLFLIDSICTLFHEWKCLELRLEWGLKKLEAVMKSADKVKSRVEAAKESSGGCQDGGNVFEIVAAFRKNFMRKCDQKNSKSYPKVLLGGTDLSSSPHGTNQRQSAPRDDDVIEVFHFLLGWFCSFTAVLNLGSNANGLFVEADLNSLPINLYDDVDLDESGFMFNDNEDSLSSVSSHLSLLPAGSPPSDLDLESAFDQVGDNEMNVEDADKSRLERGNPRRDKEDVEMSCSDVVTLLKDLPSGLIVKKEKEQVEEWPAPKIIEVSGSVGVGGANGTPVDVNSSSERNPIVKIEKPKSNTSDNAKAKVPHKKHRKLRKKRNPTPFKCLRCSVRFSNFSNFRAHLKSTSHISMKKKLLAITKKTKVVSKSVKLKKSPIASGSNEKPEQFDEKSNKNLRPRRSLAATKQPGSNEEDEDVDETSPGINVVSGDESYHGESTQAEEISSEENEYEENSSGSESEHSHNQTSSCAKTFISNPLPAQQGKTKRIRLLEFDLEEMLNNSGIDYKYKGMQFQCKEDSCHMEFITQIDLNLHSELHASFSCSFCSQVETYAPSLALHELVHLPSSKKDTFTTANQLILHCPRCSFTSTQKHLFVSHHLATHLNLTWKTAECPICQQVFVDPDVAKSLLQHIEVQHDTEGMDPDEVQKCNSDKDKCQAYFKTSRQLNMHKMKIHGEDITICQRCGKKCRDSSRAKTCKCSKMTKIQKVLAPQPVKVVKVNKRVKREPSKLICEICGKEFKERRTLLAHMLKKHGESVERFFACKYCDKKFALLHLFSLHKRSQTHKIMKAMYISKHSEPSSNVKETKPQSASASGEPEPVESTLDSGEPSKPEEIIETNVDKSQDNILESGGNGVEPVPQIISPPRSQTTRKRKLSNGHENVEDHQNEYETPCNISEEDVNVSSEDEFNPGDDSAISSSSSSDSDVECDDDDEDEDDNEENAVDDKDNVPCGFCGKKFDKSIAAAHELNCRTTGKPLPNGERPSVQARKKLVCGVASCKQKFYFEEELTNHKKLHVDFPCQFCDVVENFAVDFSLHEMTHCKNKSNDEFNCARCPYSSNRKFRYIDHHLERHLDISRKPARCFVCQAWFGETKYLRRHYQSQHNTEGVDQSKIQKCDKCSAYFLNKIQLTKHRTKLHLNLNDCDALASDISEDEEANAKEIVPEEDTANPNQKLLNCNYCNQKFLNSMVLKTHQKFEHKRNIHCEFSGCSMSFRTPEELQHHSTLHGSFPCKFCDVVETYAPTLANHELIHSFPSSDFPIPTQTRRNSRSSKGVFQCPRCPFKIIRKKKVFLAHHLETHLNLSWVTESCQICSKKFHQLDARRVHMSNYHNTEGMDPKLIERCDKCPAYFREYRQALLHRREIHKEHPLTCITCGMNFDDQTKWRNHRIRKHKVNVYDFEVECGVPNCSENFEEQYQLEYHMKNVHSQSQAETAMCPECGKVCRASAMGGHMRIHNLPVVNKDDDALQKRCVCEECGKVCKDKHILRIHLLSHTGPESWKFSCLFCEKKCLNESKLMEHLRVHTREKPFFCEDCGEEYAHAHNLRNHRNNAHSGG